MLFSFGSKLTSVILVVIFMVVVVVVVIVLAVVIVAAAVYSSCIGCDSSNCCRFSCSDGSSGSSGVDSDFMYYTMKVGSFLHRS